MNRLFVCLWIMPALSGCQITEKVTTNPNMLFLSYYRDKHDIPFYTDRGSVSHPDRLNIVIFFDVDGDGVDETLCASESETWRDYSTWRVFFYEDGGWQYADGGWRPSVIHDIVTHAHRSDFYYRVGAKRQPRLFVRDSNGKGPATIIRVNGARCLVATPISQQEFNDLLKKGKLRRVTWFWCDGDYNLHIGENAVEVDYGELEAVED